MQDGVARGDGEEGPTPAGRLLRACGAAAILALTLLAGCQTRPPATPTQLPPRAEVSRARVHAAAPGSVRFSFVITVSNPGPRSIDVQLVGSNLVVEHVPAAARKGNRELTVAGGTSVDIPVVFQINMAAIYDTLPGLRSKGAASWDFHSRVEVRFAGKGRTTLSASKQGRVPLVQVPVVHIRALRIERYDLIETKLRLELSVENPNAYAVTFHSIKYEFSADGRVWGNGTKDVPDAIPRQSTAEVSIPLRLNFIEMGRHVLDTVASLGIVHYKLVGTAHVTTPIAFMPEFTMRFDKEGSIRVRK